MKTNKNVKMFRIKKSQLHMRAAIQFVKRLKL